ncbi:MAG: hypothetical protein Q9190_005900 [Brigantiaea leucoxantha]
MVLSFATGQKAEAVRSAREFKSLHLSGWTIHHGFYANMGGFVLDAKYSDPFPINARQLQWLLLRGYVHGPTITVQDIQDKSKADGLAKALTCLQAGWFLAQIVGRAIQRLHITTFEIATLSFILYTLLISYQWARKPFDVKYPTIITSDADIRHILLEAGSAASEPYQQTPLDFIDDQSPSWLTSVQPYLRFRAGPKDRPLPRFTNDRFPEISTTQDAIFLLLSKLAICGIHLWAWEFSFPTPIERGLWRVACIVLLICAVIFWVCEIYQYGLRYIWWQRMYTRLFNIFFSHRPEKDSRTSTEESHRRRKRLLPAWLLSVMTPVTLSYIIARMYIIVEVFLSQRSLPPSAFKTVQWSEFIPHL